MSTFEYLSMRCDECGTASFINCPNHTRLTKRMTDAGWYVDGFQDLCPECRPQEYRTLATAGPSKVTVDGITYNVDSISIDVQEIEIDETKGEEE